MTKTRMQTARPIAKGRHQRAQRRWDVRENPPNGILWGSQIWPGTAPGVIPPFGLWLFETQIVTAPSAGALRMNNVNGAQVTTLWVSETLTGGTDPIASFAVNDNIRLYNRDDTQQWIEFKITAAVDSGAYRTYTVSYVGYSGSFVTPAAGTVVGLIEKTSAPGADPQMPDPVYVPGDHTVDEVKMYVDALTQTGDELRAIVQAILDAERDDKNRSTLVDWLDAKVGVI